MRPSGPPPSHRSPLGPRPGSALPLLILAGALSACGGSESGELTGTYNVSIVSVDAEDFGEGCPAGDYASIEQQFTYDIYQEGLAIEVKVDGETFATGAFSDGCTIEYTSPAYLDEYQGAEVQWQIEGTAELDGPAGGCVDDPDLDWVGVELALVSRSDTDALPQGCTRTLDTTGTRVE